MVDSKVELLRDKKFVDVFLSVEQVNVKAKSAEGLGLLGKAEGIASYAIVSVLPKKE